MNEKLIHLLKASRHYALEYTNILQGHTDVNATSGVFEHIELLKNAINVLERENMNLASGADEEHSSPKMGDRDNEMCHLMQSLQDVRVELARTNEGLRSLSLVLTQLDLGNMEKRIMSAISDWKEAVDKTFDEIDTKLDTANTKLTGLTDDVAFLKETIEKLQTNPGPITPEDQALLDAAQARVNSLSAKAAAVATALEALDAATERPPAPPVPPA